MVAILLFKERWGADETFLFELPYKLYEKFCNNDLTASNRDLIDFIGIFGQSPIENERNCYIVTLKIQKHSNLSCKWFLLLFLFLLCYLIAIIGDVHKICNA